MFTWITETIAADRWRPAIEGTVVAALSAFAEPIAATGRRYGLVRALETLTAAAAVAATDRFGAGTVAAAELSLRSAALLAIAILRTGQAVFTIGRLAEAITAACTGAGEAIGAAVPDFDRAL